MTFTVPGIVDELNLRRRGPIKPNVDRAYWNAIALQAAKAGVLIRDGSTNGDDEYQYAVSEWGWHDVRPFAGHVANQSVRQSEGTRELISEPRFPRPNQVTHLFGRLGLLQCATIVPVTFDYARAVLDASEALDPKYYSEVIRGFRKHKYVEDTPEGFNVVEDKREIVQGYFDMLAAFLTDPEDFAVEGADHIQRLTAHSDSIHILEEHAVKASNNVSGRKVTDYEALGSRLRTLLLEGPISVMDLSNLFPDLTDKQLRTLKQRTYNGQIPGIKCDHSKKHRIFELDTTADPNASETVSA